MDTVIGHINHISDAVAKIALYGIGMLQLVKVALMLIKAIR